MKSSTKFWIGAVAWLAFVAAARSTPVAPAWTHVLITFCALVLVSLVFDLLVERRDSGKTARAFTWAGNAHLPAATLLALSCGLRPGLWALLLAIPWVAVTALFATVGFGRMLRDAWARPLDRLATDVGLGFLVIGGLWLLVDRSGLRPMQFAPEIIALTAAHFHFAGFLLPLFAGQVLRQMPESRFAARGLVGTVLGVPAVAVGITVSQLGGTPAIEAAAACGLALAGMTIGILHVRWALDERQATMLVRTLVAVSGASLFFAMILSISYAARNYVTMLPWLGLPQMRAVHGTLIAFGFALCGALGWSGYALARPAKR